MRTKLLLVFLLIFSVKNAPADDCNPWTVLAGGYLGSVITTKQGGTLSWFGLAGQDLPDGLTVRYAGIDTGIAADSRGGGVYGLDLALAPGSPVGSFPLEFGSGGETLWPYLNVTEGRSIPSPAKPYFTNAAERSGLNEAGYNSARQTFYDFDGDGWLDVLVDRTHVLMNRPQAGGGRRFVDFTTEAGMDAITNLAGDKRVPTVTVCADIDNDGDIDCYSGMYLDFRASTPTPDAGFRSAIFLNDGTGRFTIKADSGVEVNPGTEVPAGFVDYDNDGCLDLLVGYFYSNYGVSYEAYPNRLYKGHCDGTFTDVTEAAGMLTVANANLVNSSRPTYGLCTSDWNDDGYQDIFWAVYGRQRNYLWRSLGGQTFIDVGRRTTFEGDGNKSDTSEPWFRQNGNSFGVQPADFNNDGFMDVILYEITHSWAGPASDLTSILSGRGPDFNWAFLRATRGTGRPRNGDWNQGDIHAGWIDYDNDMRQDLLICSGDYPDGQYLRLFEQTDAPDPNVNGWFKDATDLADFNWESGADLAVGDYDRDGDPDILVGRSLMRMPTDKRERWGTRGGLMSNNIGASRSWAVFRLEGKGQGHSNRQGIGAKITVEANGVTQVREILGACGHAGQMNAQEAHFGLGDACKIDKLTVRWPNSRLTTQTWENVEPDTVYVIREGDGNVTVWGR